MMSTDYRIRRFLPDEWQELKAIRLEALKNEPGNFGASYKEEFQVLDAKWVKRVQRSNEVYFALCYGNEIVGITGVIIDNHKTTKLMASYIRKEHRGKGLSKLFYEARIEWAQKQGAKKILVSHRKSNLPSMYANQIFGFAYIGEDDVIWPDGNHEPIVNYELVL